MDSIKEAEKLLDDLLDDRVTLEKFITEPKDLIFDDLSRTQRHVPRVPNPHRLFRVDVSPLTTTLKVDRDLTTGELLGFHEVELSDIGKTAKTSTSMKRAPGPPNESVRGNPTNVPFWPGGMDEPTLKDLQLPDDKDIDFENNFETVPPGFDYGLTFTDELKQEKVISAEATHKTKSRRKSKQYEINITQLLMDFDEGLDLEGDNMKINEKPKSSETTEVTQADNLTKDDDGDLDEIVLPKLPPANEVLVISKDENPTTRSNSEWVEVVNVNTPVIDFHKKVPSMAKNWNFELDIFQKQAILHLERHESVFVAAHTSAGKTVVAEYAIALSLKHMTRAIYTSPIKALSNQKFRDFKEAFEDVGLLTGDIQINQNASCLIMTTEILRSMLYNGSDAIRDLEWVIFDEVHYINDPSRGVVWEEVLILLPQQVNIVLLSATVPNTVQFAEWVGRTKRKKIYVISTPKRPVPLEHFVFLGWGGKNDNSIFPIVKADGKLYTESYTAALRALKESKSKNKQFGYSTVKEKNLYVNIINLLKTKDQLPVVLFTFSRKRCDDNARLLINQDLTTSIEKSHIRNFVFQCMKRLKESDRKLPQVLLMSELLKNGIGIHHSGILPILREVVELLFQRGLVKLLFATETFAMGVNMPARTVVFDAIQKFDGMSKRNLNTAEYIQMAGRAGRRGIDTTGMVVVICRNSIPELSELHLMILGKATCLESKFHVTYSMILNLLSVESISMTEMMKRSFFEVENQKSIPAYEKKLGELNSQITSQVEVECPVCSSSIEQYYYACSEYVNLKLSIQEVVLSLPQVLVPGRVVIISLCGGKPSYAAVLKSKRSGSNNPLEITVLIMEDAPVGGQDYDEMWPHFLNASKVLPKMPDAIQNMSVVACQGGDVLLILNNVLRLDPSRVLSNWEKRQMPRFKDDPPSDSFLMAGQSFLALINKIHLNLKELDPVVDLGQKEIDFYDKVSLMKRYKEKLNSSYPCTSCSAFDVHFNHTYKNMRLRAEASNIQRFCSNLALQPEYEAMVEVLKELGYINVNCTLRLKGRVARQISTNHDLFITELIVENLFTEMQPAEIASLLSSMVFQEKHSSEPELNQVLLEGIDKIVKVATRIAEIQRSNGIQIPVEDYVKQFNFNLAQVVYEWAKGTSFTDITSLTDVQEGVIVRTIQRLDEVLRNVMDAAKMVGNPVLQKKMEEASQAIKRDIVFAASLYTQ